jgi:hypothetical protein
MHQALRQWALMCRTLLASLWDRRRGATHWTGPMHGEGGGREPTFCAADPRRRQRIVTELLVFTPAVNSRPGSFGGFWALPIDGVSLHRQLDCERAHFWGDLIVIPLDHENVVAICTE